MRNGGSPFVEAILEAETFERADATEGDVGLTRGEDFAQ